MTLDVSDQRWWGWGTLDSSYSLEDRPHFWPYLAAALGLTGKERCPIVPLESIALRPCRLSPSTLTALRSALGTNAVSTAHDQRLRHAMGKSYRDLVRLRHGQVPNPPDAVVYPATEEQVAAVLRLARDHGFTVIPFGGGTSVTGGVEPQGDRPAVSLNLRRLNQVLAIDPLSRTATVQAGILGPDLEQALNRHGFTLGHFPQSWEFSTLGGWIATRSAGQQSTGYGKIEEMVISLRVVTPMGVIQTRATPASAAGPSLKDLFTGSEGIFGVITQATVRLQSLPAVRDYRGLVFRSFGEGIEALRHILQSGLAPVTLRLSDANETRASLAMQRASKGFAAWKEQMGKWLLARLGYDLRLEPGLRQESSYGPSLLILGCEGEAAEVEHTRHACLTICRQHGAFHLGHSVGRQWYAERFTLPYLRDVLLDHGILVDTLETATIWSNVALLHQRVARAISQGADTSRTARGVQASGSEPGLATDRPRPVYVMCHISHVYQTGASLYFTFLARQVAGQEIEQWEDIKKAATECIMANGGTLSHHHGIGYEHAPWLAAEDSPLGIELLRAAKSALDPTGIMNPGKMGL